MKLTYEKVSHHLKSKLAKIYFLYGDEPLLIQELVNQISKAANEQGFNSIKNLQASTTFKWNELLEEFSHHDLFSEKTYIKLTLPTGKPGITGSKVLLEYINTTYEDCLLVIISSNLEATTLKSSWYQAIEKNGVTVHVRALQGTELIESLKQRLAQHNMNISHDALELLADKTMGNLLAAQQAIEKLSLSYGAIEILPEHIEETTADQAYFDIFNLSNAWLREDHKEYFRILKQLKAQGIATTLILWIISREARQLAQFAFRIKQGETLQEALQSLPAFRRPALQQHLKNHDQHYYHQILQQCAVIDRMIKGLENGDEWVAFERLALYEN